MKIIILILLVSILIILSLPVEVVSYTAPEAPVKPTIKEYAEQRVNEVFGEGQWSAFDKVIFAESNWVHTAKNPKSSAYGLCQTMMSLHKVPLGFREDPYLQVDWCVQYMKRYGDPQKAWIFWQKNKWF